VGRSEAHALLQGVLEHEVTALSGPGEHERRGGVDAAGGCRNGCGEARTLTLSCGTVEVQRPRLRGLEARFENRILPLFRKRSKQLSAGVAELCLPELAGDASRRRSLWLRPASATAPISSWRCVGCWAMGRQGPQDAAAEDLVARSVT